MGEPSGLYFPGLTKGEVNEVRRRLAELAAGLGYVSKTGPNKGRGSVGLLLAAIATGEVTLTPVSNKPNAADT